MTADNRVPRHCHAADLNPVTYHDAPDHPNVAMVRNGRRTGEIVVRARGAMVRAAAEDLQRFIRAATGADLPLLAEAGERPAIVIGDSPSPDKLARTFGPGVRDVSPFLLARDDSIMVFLDVTGRRTGCYTLIVNANGALHDARGEDVSWNAAGLRVATAIGTDCWTLQLYIPVSAFEDAVPPRPGVTWYGNFARHRVGDGSAPEHQRVNSTYLPPDEDQNAFVPIRFAAARDR